MQAESEPRYDKEAARALIEDGLRRLGMKKGELARSLYMSASVFSRKLGARHPFERFSSDELARIGELLNLDRRQRALLRRSHGYIESPAAPAGAVQARAATTPATNLPVQLTSFIGRERERAEVERLLRTARLVTVTGAGGCGKTRLALEIASRQVQECAGGVWLVELAGLPPERHASDANAGDTADLVVTRAAARALSVRETAARPLLQSLIDALRSRRTLVLLDNCEHVIGASARLVQSLLGSCPELVVLATSREPLSIPGEVQFRTPSLTVPGEPYPLAPSPPAAPLERGSRLVRMDSLSPSAESGGGGGRGVESLTDSELLLVDRVRAQIPSFEVTARNRVAVARICRQLDGIPLAIELAAARTPALSLDEIAERLSDALRLLNGGNRTAMPRQQTLGAALDWSHDLLTERERAVFRRLAVFAGGCALEAVEAVCGQEPAAEAAHRPHETLDEVTRLVSKSLVVVDEQDTETRYRLLEPVRQYAERRLREAGESFDLRRRHRDYYLSLAERAEPNLIGAARQLWMARLEQEHDNLRAALTWSMREDQGGDGEPGLRLAAALWRFWLEHGYLGEGRRWLEGALAAAIEAPLTARAKALAGAGVLAREQGDYTRAASLYGEALGHFRHLGDRRGEAGALNSLGMVVRDQGDFERARSLYEEALSLRRELGDRQSEAATLNNLALLLGELGEVDEAVTLHEESLAIKREFGDRRGIAASLNNLGMLARARGDLARAVALYTDSLALFRELRDTWGVGVLLNNLGNAMRDRGDVRRAATLYTESLELRRDLGDKPGTAWCLEGLAAVALAEGRAERGVMLLGAAEAVREAIGATVPLAERADRERTLAAARAALDEFGFSVAWARGRAMTLDDAITRALEAAHPVA